MGCLIYRLNDKGERVEEKWFEGDQNKGAAQPVHFDYEKFTLYNVRRYWWDYALSRNGICHRSLKLKLIKVMD